MTLWNKFRQPQKKKNNNSVKKIYLDHKKFQGSQSFIESQSFIDYISNEFAQIQQEKNIFNEILLCNE